MVTKQDVTTALLPIITDSPFGDGKQVIKLDDNGGSFVYVDTFVSLFSSAASMTAEALHEVDGGRIGYGSYIDEWKAKGYIS